MNEFPYQVKNELHVAPLTEWDKLFAAVNTSLEADFFNWDATPEDDIEKSI